MYDYRVYHKTKFIYSFGWADTVRLPDSTIFSAWFSSYFKEVYYANYFLTLTSLTMATMVAYSRVG